MTAPDVALFLPSLEGGGAERVMLDIGSALAARGHSVEVVLGRAGGPLVSPLPVVSLDAGRTMTSVTGLAGYLRRRRPRTMVSALSHANVVAVAAKVLARSDVRLLLTEHVHLTTNTERARSPRDRAMPFILRAAYRGRLVAAVSEGVARDLEQRVGLPSGSVHVLPNPIPADELRKKAEEPVPHPWFSEPTPVVLGVGRLNQQKDFATLLRAVALTREQIPNLRAVILGEGPERASLEQLASSLGLADAVAMPGFVTNPYPAFRSAAAFVLSSRWEGLPTVLIEALAVGVPVISTDCPSGPQEILQGGRWGRIAPVGDAAALAAAIADTVRAGPDAVAPPNAVEAYDPELIASRYEELLGL